MQFIYPKVHSKFAFTLLAFFLIFIGTGCKKTKIDTPKNTDIALSFTVNDTHNGPFKYNLTNLKPVIKFNFTEAINTSTITISGSFKLVKKIVILSIAKNL